HLVQVRGEDLLLRPDAGELLGEAHLLDLARDRPLVRADVEVADELLRERRAALHDSTGLRVGIQRARDALVVERAVLPETAILDRDGRLRQPWRHLPQ